jgi:DNA adenine methylase
MNYYDKDDHNEIGRKIQKIKNMRWIVSYDNVPEIRKLYKSFRKKEYELTHIAYEVRRGKEILFFSNSLIVPNIYSIA